MVFAPAPVLTVTIERHQGGAELHIHPGGQGVWQARMIASLGVEVTLCAATGGETGAILTDLLSREPISVRTVHRQSPSGWYVHDRRAGRRDEVAHEPGDALARHDLDELYNVALAEGLRAPVALLSGPADPSVLAPDGYRRLAADLGGTGCRVVADLSGDHLTAALAGGLALVKVAHDELLKDRRAAADTVRDLVAAARRLRAEGAENVLVSHSDRPALALLGDRVLEISAPRLQAVDPRGAGDSMTAGAVAVLARGGDLTEAVRTGAAAGALNVTRHGLGTGRADAIRELIERVAIAPLEGTGAS
ncbi:1-phosphofructokinase family hexose kinase [Rhizomonospora bruguierae]|uniref:1-phosphofructokinase family hexose kinase n=1 Tax=Rhizomonospora bruguierae TaxID=1581705 RepID=UPI001BCE4834|nr:PfkB family carbohydrate kinase [Micromonospora sp. NBRC 107566]